MILSHNEFNDSEGERTKIEQLQRFAAVESNKYGRKQSRIDGIQH